MLAQDNIRAVFGVHRAFKGADCARGPTTANHKAAPISATISDLDAPAAVAIAAGAAALLGVLVGGELVVRGLAQLEVAARRRARVTGAATGLIAGAGAVLAARHTGSWWLLPAALVWAFGLAATATCDAMTQRVPTPLVRRSGLLTAVLVLGASAGAGQWRWSAAAAFAAVAAGTVFWFCWRFLGAGYGDVRMAILGGVGLANPTSAGIAAAIAAFVVITLGQAVVTLARGGNRQTLFPYGPAIAAAFVVAAIA